MENSAQNNQVQKNKWGGLRWGIGFVFILMVASTLLTYAGFVITSEKNMKPILAKSLDIAMRQGDPTQITAAINYINELSKHKEQLASLQSLNNIDQAQIEKETAGMTPEQSQKYYEDKIAGPLYEGTKLAKDLQNVDPDAKVEIDKMSFFSSATTTQHNLLWKAFLIQSVILFILLIVLILLSSGLGRLSAPGIVILLGSLPGFIIFGYPNILIDILNRGTLKQYMDKSVYNDILNQIVYPLMATIKGIYFIPTLIGAGLLIIAVILGLILKISKKAAPAS